jgi:phosphatidylserine/phosphatidylglycerophosphate/cardiolipin synthase-like enzyme
VNENQLAALALFVEEVAYVQVVKLATLLENGEDLISAGERLQSRRAREHVDLLASTVSDVDSAHVLPAALRAAAIVSEKARDRRVEPVWTGPVLEDNRVPVRSTVGVVSDVLHAASRRIVIASFAVYGIQATRQALLSAADRGIVIDFIVESAAGTSGGMNLAELQRSPELLKRIRLWTWPADRRPALEKGSASLHAKFVLADGERLLVTSANLTDRALDANMEFGLLVEGGNAPRTLERLVDQLIRQGDLLQILE